MQIHQLVLGDYQTNCYCLTATQTSKDCVIIDTGLAAEPLVDLLKEKALNPVALILTHGHADHIAGVGLVRKSWPDVKVVIHKNDAEMLNNPVENLSALAGVVFKSAPAEIIIEQEKTIALGGIEFEVLHTPGHTQGGVSLYCKKEGVVFVGDSLFAGSIGRTDFPGGDCGQLVSGIKQKLLSLPGETKVLPGHGPATTIAIEKQSNQYLIT